MALGVETTAVDRVPISRVILAAPWILCSFICKMGAVARLCHRTVGRITGWAANMKTVWDGTARRQEVVFIQTIKCSLSGWQAGASAVLHVLRENGSRCGIHPAAVCSGGFGQASLAVVNSCSC